VAEQPGAGVADAAVGTDLTRLTGLQNVQVDITIDEVLD